MKEANRSIPEWAASLSMPRDPVNRPATSFSTVTTAAAVTEKMAALRFSLREFAIPDCAGSDPAAPPPGEAGATNCVAAGLIRLMLQGQQCVCTSSHGYTWRFHPRYRPAVPKVYELHADSMKPASAINCFIR